MNGRDRCIENILEDRIAVIVRGADASALIPLGEAILRGGIHAMEVTFDPTGKVSDGETVTQIARLADHFGERMQIGAGTVLSPTQADAVADVGGTFIVSPNTDERVIQRTSERGLVSIPGALTPTEIQNAHSFGADFVKVFPVTSLGTDYLKLITAPLRHIRLAAVGGIRAEDVANYLAAGATCFCIGGAIADPKMIRLGNFDAITENAARFVRAVKAALSAD